MTPEIRILRIVTRLTVGGPALHVTLLKREMASLGYETILVCGSCEAGEGDAAYLLETGDGVHWIPEMSRSVQPWNSIRALWRLFRPERPDIAHDFTVKPNVYGTLAAWMAGVPSVLSHKCVYKVAVPCRGSDLRLLSR